MSIVNRVIRNVIDSLGSPIAILNKMSKLTVADDGSGRDRSRWIVKDDSGVEHSCATFEEVVDYLDTYVLTGGQSPYVLVSTFADFVLASENPSIENVYCLSGVQFPTGANDIFVTRSKNIYGDQGAFESLVGANTPYVTFNFPLADADQDIHIKFFTDITSNGSGIAGPYIIADGNYAGNTYSYKLFVSETIDNTTLKNKPITLQGLNDMADNVFYEKQDRETILASDSYMGIVNELWSGINTQLKPIRDATITPVEYHVVARRDFSGKLVEVVDTIYDSTPGYASTSREHYSEGSMYGRILSFFDPLGSGNASRFRFDLFDSSDALQQAVTMNGDSQMSLGSGLDNWDETVKVFQIDDHCNYIYTDSSGDIRSGIVQGAFLFDASTNDWRFGTTAYKPYLIEIVEGVKIEYVATATGSLGGVVTFVRKTWIESGTYVPTITNQSGIDSLTVYECQYTRIDERVMVTGSFELDPSASALTSFNFSLPFSTTFTSSFQLTGKAVDDYEDFTFTALGTVGTSTGFFTAFHASPNVRILTFDYAYRIL